MADVELVPKIRCDNCGKIEDKAKDGIGRHISYGRPRTWGHMKAEGGRVIPDTYGTGKERLDFSDLCPECAEAAFEAAHAALKPLRGE